MRINLSAFVSGFFVVASLDPQDFATCLSGFGVTWESGFEAAACEVGQKLLAYCPRSHGGTGLLGLGKVRGNLKMLGVGTWWDVRFFVG